MANAIATVPSRSVLVDMATRWGMDPAAFEQTLRATVVPSSASKEQFAAFLLVAKQYQLNPLTKEIYAFPARNGGIQPIVSVDGWANIINSHPAFDGLEFDDHIGEDGKLTAITARIWRKDRTKPTIVTEYMSECRRSTDTWKQWPARMLRHKAMIQAARYAFGFAGIIDPDEFERMADVSPTRNVTPSSVPMTALSPPTQAAAPGEETIVWEDPPTEGAAADFGDGNAESSAIDTADRALSEAAERGMEALKAEWVKLPEDVRTTLKVALDRRHKPRAAAVDAAEIETS